MSVGGALCAFALVLSGLAACASPPQVEDRTAFLEHMPHSILVLPPLEETPVADAPYQWLGSITRPLAERGYYVFPVAMVDAIMKENGLPTPGEMHQVSLQKLWEVFGADAVLYVTLKEWGTSYMVVSSHTSVSIQARLVDVRTGVEIWRGERTAVEDSSSGQDSIAGLIIGALAAQVAASASDPTPALARRANWELFHEEPQGLLVGPRDPGFEQDQAKRRGVATAAVAPAKTP